MEAFPLRISRHWTDSPEYFPLSIDLALPHPDFPPAALFCSHDGTFIHLFSLPPQFRTELKDVDAPEEGTATLRCELSKPARVEWKKDERKLAEGNKYQIRQQGALAELVIRDLEIEDGGRYTCTCGDQKTTAILTVNALKPEFQQQLKNEKAEEGGTARFCCKVTVAKAPVEWRKDGVPLRAGAKYEMRQEAASRELLVHHLEPKDSGEYSCVTGDQTTSATLAVKALDVTILRGLKDAEAFEEEDVVFECKVSHDNARDVEWKLQDALLQSNEMNEISVEKGRIHTLRLKKVTQQDSGTITFRVGPYASTAQLKVKAPLPTFKEELTNKDLQEDSTVTLKCEVSQPSVSATWKKGTQVISPSSKYEIEQEGTVHTLKIYNLKPEDSGRYTCDIGNQKSTATVSVAAKGPRLALVLTALLQYELSRIKAPGLGHGEVGGNWLGAGIHPSASLGLAPWTLACFLSALSLPHTEHSQGFLAGSKSK
ncbi:Obscurin [Varanus komodoensis]|nr:Obscurin [Varanus komodoensis]